MFLAYHFLLARDNQHRFNRGVILIIYGISFLTLPIISLYNRIIKDYFGSVQSISFDDNAISIPFAGTSQPLWSRVLVWLFVLGMIAVFLRTIIIWIRILRIIHSGTKIKRARYTLVITENDRYAPFSWIRYIIIHKNDYESKDSAIITHELNHIASKHWIDLLIAQSVCIINWFNPAAWLMQESLMLVHEYQSDLAVIRNGRNPQEYQMLLIKKAVGSRFPSLANSLNHSKLKKRITMMYKEKSCARQKYKALALVPMLALALGLSSIPSVRAAVSTISSSSISVGKGNENTSKGKAAIKIFQVSNIKSEGSQTTVTIHGENLGDNLTISGGTFKNQGKTYYATSLYCDMTDGVATITATFPFSGDLRNPSMTIEANGEEIPFELSGFKPKAEVSSIQEKNTPLASEEIEILLNGKRISKEDMKALNPESIASMTVDKEKGTINIETK